MKLTKALLSLLRRGYGSVAPPQQQHVKVAGDGLVTNVAEDGVSLKLQGPSLRRPLLLHPTWLRDHCRCADCYDQGTHNKLVDIAVVGLDVRPRLVEVSKDRLHVTWPDGHLSNFSLEWLEKNVYENYKDRARPDKKLWDSSLDSVSIRDAVVRYDQYVSSEGSLKTVLKAVVERGFGIVQGVPQTKDGLADVVERICPPRLGFFGRVHEFGHHMLHGRRDESFQEATLPHADQIYLTEPAGLKIVQCQETNNKMLITMVDGFRVAQQLKALDEASYATLSSVPVVSEYVDDAFHHRTHDVILKHDRFNDSLLQVRYNEYYRAALSSVPFSQMGRFYEALARFTSLVLDGSNQCRIQLTPGTVLLMDNWRILSSFSQSDDTVRLNGSYLGWSDYMCRARRLNVVP